MDGLNIMLDFKVDSVSKSEGVIQRACALEFSDDKLEVIYSILDILDIKELTVLIIKLKKYHIL